ncbi:MAG: VRR-NUC domain-containing protein [Magnetococcales bacterium]|nr:VRR-NUC domain-containing protein [Magnetococcales bacterium]
MRETVIKKEILLALTRFPHITLFNNPCGQGWAGGEPVKFNDGSFGVRNPRRLNYGLVPGSSDLIGWRITTVTPDMVGKQVAIFAAIEVKQPNGRSSEEQKRFIANVQAAGGIAGIARTVDDAKALMQE